MDMMLHLIMGFMLLLMVKHTIADFFLQPPYMFMNKGTYGHPGGLLHVAVTIIGTIFAILALYGFAGYAIFSIKTITIALIAEAVIHYHMDFFKMWYNKKKCWCPNTHSEFWYLTGIDQGVHMLTYVAMCWYMFWTVL